MSGGRQTLGVRFVRGNVDTQEDHLAPLLDRLGLDRSDCVNTVLEFGRVFK